MMVMMLFIIYAVAQVITAEQLVAQVTNLSMITGFGFSLDGKVDADNNQYRGVTIPTDVAFL